MSKRRFVDVLLVTFRPLVALILKCWVNYRLIKAPPKGLKPPYLVLSSHITDFDAFLLMMHLSRFPVAVVHELLFRNPFLRVLLLLFGTIIKRSGIPEAMCIRQMKRAVAAGRSVLIYPQGDVIWAGRNEPLGIEVARLARYLGVPVLVMRQDGAYTTYPRWANGVRRGRIDITYCLAVTSEDYAKYDDKTLLAKISACFDHDEAGWLAEGGGRKVVFISRAPARGLQRLLFMCPSCGSYGNMSGRGRRLACDACGSSALVTPRLGLIGQAQGFKDIWQWHGWQMIRWKEIVAEAYKGETIMLSERSIEVKAITIPKVTASSGHNSAFPRRMWRPGALIPAARAELTNAGISIWDENGRIIRQAPFSCIDTAYVASFYRPNLLIIKAGEEYLRIRFRRHANPAYAWNLAIRQLMPSPGA